ncbi:MAG: hypothetical protein KJS92_10675, partial [Bacteroidetes bacterium]|nr:hypothetical protein [Bacteroidota bacterium]
MDRIRHIVVFASWYPAGAQGLNGNFIRDFARALSSRYRVSVIHVGANPALKSPQVSVSRSERLNEYVAILP